MNEIPRRKWTIERIKIEILSLKDLSAKNCQRDRPDLYGAAVRRFGSWRKAIEFSGFDYSQVRRKRENGFWTSDRIIECILLLNEKHSAYVRKNHADLYNAALRFFGSWQKAITSAGFEYSQIEKGWPPKSRRKNSVKD